MTARRTNRLRLGDRVEFNGTTYVFTCVLLAALSAGVQRGCLPALRRHRTVPQGFLVAQSGVHQVFWLQGVGIGRCSLF